MVQCVGHTFPQSHHQQVCRMVILRHHTVDLHIDTNALCDRTTSSQASVRPPPQPPPGRFEAILPQIQELWFFLAGAPAPDTGGQSRQFPILLCTRILAVRISCCRVISAIFFPPPAGLALSYLPAPGFVPPAFPRSSCSLVTSVALICMYAVPLSLTVLFSENNQNRSVR